MQVSEAMSVEKLLGAWLEANSAVRAAQLARYDIEKVIEAKMGATRAEIAEAEGVSATFKAETIWDQGRLAGLAEIMSPEEFAALLTVPPPPPEPRVNVARAKPLAKRGGMFREIIEAAQAPGLPVLKIKVKEASSG